MDIPAEHTIGLRFTRACVKPLEMITRIIRTDTPGSHDVAIFDKALIAATTGEPLIVICQHPDEAARIADSFTRIGIERPAIEALTPGG